VPDVETHPDSQASIPKVFMGLAVASMVVLAGLVFVHAWLLDWMFGCIYVVIFAATWAITLACLLRWNPVLIRRRMYLCKGTKTWDKVWLGLFAPVAIGIYVVAALEVREEVSIAQAAAWLLGLAIFVPSWVLVIWSMVVNPFFEKTVRIQTDHGHRVIDTGPYAYVRHPGYVGFAGWMLSTPLLLASAWAFVPALVAVVALVIRTALEDRTLQAELPGYPEYVARVRFRLIPGVW
jgi:protein-S-isoprenylcysteine O-methyltransferase Ste14